MWEAVLLGMVEILFPGCRPSKDVRGNPQLGHQGAQDRAPPSAYPGAPEVRHSEMYLFQKPQLPLRGLSAKSFSFQWSSRCSSGCVALSAVTTENKEELRGKIQRTDHQGTAGRQRAEPVCPEHKEIGAKGDVWEFRGLRQWEHQACRGTYHRQAALKSFWSAPGNVGLTGPKPHSWGLCSISKALALGPIPASS